MLGTEVQPDQKYAVKSRDIAAEDFDGEFVVLDLSTGKYFGLSGGSAVVWRGLTAGHSIASLCAQLPADDPRRAEIEALVQKLVDDQLLAPADEGVAPDATTATELASAPGPFTVEMFDDLADLILTDPIHDVDQDAGWPHRPQDN